MLRDSIHFDVFSVRIDCFVGVHKPRWEKNTPHHHLPFLFWRENSRNNDEPNKVGGHQTRDEERGGLQIAWPVGGPTSIFLPKPKNESTFIYIFKTRSRHCSRLDKSPTIMNEVGPCTSISFVQTGLRAAQHLCIAQTEPPLPYEIHPGK